MFYIVDRDKDGRKDEYYYDMLQDDINGNEIRCSSLEDCMTKAFVEKKCSGVEA